MLAVTSESEADEVALRRAFRQPLFGKVRDLAAAQICHGDRLAPHALLRSVACVQEYRITTVGTYSDGGRKAVEFSQPAAPRFEQLAAGQMRSCFLHRVLGDKYRRIRNDSRDKEDQRALQGSS